MGSSPNKLRAGQRLKLKAVKERAARLNDFTDERLGRYVRWQEMLAALGRTALASSTLDELMAQAVNRLAKTLQIDYVAIFELDAERQSLALRAGHGWRKGVVGHAMVGASRASQAGFTILANEPIVLSDLESVKRFADAPLLVQHGAVSGVTVVIEGHPRPYGVLGVYSTQLREFAADEIRFLRTVANMLAAAVRGFEADQAQRDGAARVQAIVSTLVDGVITIDEHGLIESINSAAEKIFGYAGADVMGLNVNVLMPEPYQSEHDGYIRNYLTTGRQRIIGIGREVLGRRRDGTTFPMDLAVNELHVSGKRMFTGVVRDVTERRRMEREILEAGADEQRRIGQDLHDGLCQHLAGISFATEVLRQKLAARSAPEETSISKIGRMIDEAITQARGLARGLQPVDLDTNGLTAALRELVEKVEEMFHVACQFVCAGACPVYDNNVATHLFRIAQEAISNAIKHGKARMIIVDLVPAGEELTLSIKDDGVGLGSGASIDGARDGGRGAGAGMGLRTMDYRARVIGGTLSVQSRRAGGTTIVCRVRNQSASSEVRNAIEGLGHGKEERRGRKAASKNPRGRRPSDRARASG